jgi:hypothetical protein
MTTKEDSLAHAKEIAENRYLELRGKSRAGQLKSEPTFKHAAERFLLEYATLTVGQRNPRYIQSQKDRLRFCLVPFFGKKVLSEITPGLVQEYRIARSPTPRVASRLREARRIKRSWPFGRC